MVKIVSYICINKSGLSNTFLSISEISVTKKISLTEGKNMRWLSLSLLEAGKMYFLSAYIFNELALFPIILDSTFSHLWDS